MKKSLHRSLQLHAVSASFVGLSLMMAIALVASSYLPVSSSFPSSSSQASVLAVDDSSSSDTSSDDETTDDNVGDDENIQTPEEELESSKKLRGHFVDAVKVRNSSKSKVRSFKSMMASCDRKPSGKSKGRCLVNLAPKMQLSLRAICAFDDIVDMNCEDTSGFPYNPTSKDFSAEDEVTPFLEDVLQALDSNLTSLAPQLLNDYIKEVDARIEELTSFLNDNADEDETDAPDDDAAKVDPNRECFDRNQKAYLATRCIELRKSQGSL